MRAAALVLGLAALIEANPLPQSIDLNAVEAAGPPPTVSVPMGEGAVAPTIVPYDPTSVFQSTEASITANPLPVKRAIQRRDACASQPAGSGPIPSSDTPDAFLAFSSFAAAATGAPTPSGYVNTFQNLKTSNNANSYMGYRTLDTYDTGACAAFCESATGCSAFNILFERDPSIEPADACPNPPSTTVIKCVLWGGPVTSENAVNDGQWRNDFHVVIAGSNGYVNQEVSDLAGYSGNFLNNAAINAPNDCNGKGTYMGYRLFNDGAPFDAGRCKAACEATSAFDIEHGLPSASTPDICRFFNTYILEKNGVSQGQYCAMYTQSWDSSYAVNTGQWQDSDHYTISYSYSYSSTSDMGSAVCSSDLSYLSSQGGAFCSSYIGYVAPVTTVTATVTTTVPGTKSYLKRDVMNATESAIFTTGGLMLLEDAAPTNGSFNASISLPTSTGMVKRAAFATPAPTLINLPKRTVVATPSSIATWPASKISSACSSIATGTVTSTVTATSTATSCALREKTTCFTITGHGDPWIEGKKLGAIDHYTSPSFDYPSANIYYIDDAGHMWSTLNDWPMGTDRTGGGAWMAFYPPGDIQLYPGWQYATCSRDYSDARVLTCYQTSTSQMTIWSYHGDSRGGTPMFGYPDSSFKPITLSWDQVQCPC